MQVHRDHEEQGVHRPHTVDGQQPMPLDTEINDSTTRPFGTTETNDVGKDDRYLGDFVEDDEQPAFTTRSDLTTRYSRHRSQRRCRLARLGPIYPTSTEAIDP